MQKKQLQPGTFGPTHNGHISQTEDFITKYNPKQHIIGIGFNPSKVNGEFHHQERKGLMQDAIQDLDPDIQAKIHIDFIHGLVQDYCTRHGIAYIRKSYRNDQDRYDEHKQLYYNERLNPYIKTTVDQADSSNPLINLSSSGEKLATTLGMTLFAPNTTIQVKQALEMRLNQQYFVSMTGEMGSGKSYTGTQFEQLGKKWSIPTYNIDLDGLGHVILSNESYYQDVRENLVDAFGPDIMDEQGNIKRGILAQRAFADEESTNKLNSIMEQAMRVEIRSVVAGKQGLIIFNGAIIAEHDIGVISNYNTINVGVDTKTQLERVLARENSETNLNKRGGMEFTAEEFEKRKKTQRTLEQKQSYFAQQQQEIRNGVSIDFDNSDPNKSDTEQAFLNTVDGIDKDLSLRFGALCVRLGLTCDTKKLFFDIYHRYLNNNLPYHNRQHIKDGVRQIHTHRDKMHEPDLVEMAYMFHDIIYDPQAPAGQNESLSAQLAEQMLRGSGLSIQQIFTIKHLILATKHEGKPYGYTHDEQYMMDIDMSIIGSNEEKYLHYSKSIRQEYNHYPDEAYNYGRKEFLTKFKSKKIFYTPEYQTLEDQAKQNIEIEIITLS